MQVYTEEEYYSKWFAGVKVCINEKYEISRDVWKTIRILAKNRVFRLKMSFFS